MIYEPSEDTFLIAEQVKKFAKGRVLDMGTGSGYLAEIALEKTKDVVAADISEESIEFVKKKNIITIKSDLFSDIEGKFDLIIFNPPYFQSLKLDHFVIYKLFYLILFISDYIKKILSR